MTDAELLAVLRQDCVFSVVNMGGHWCAKARGPVFVTPNGVKDGALISSRSTTARGAIEGAHKQWCTLHTLAKLTK